MLDLSVWKTLTVEEKIKIITEMQLIKLTTELHH
jgi:hypothetical protein